MQPTAVFLPIESLGIQWVPFQDDTGHTGWWKGAFQSTGSQVSPIFWKMMKEYFFSFSSSHLLCLGTKTPVGTVGTKT